MKRTIVLLVLIAALVAMYGCLNPVEEIIPNEPPIVNFVGLHSPNGIEQHAPYEWDVYGNGYDPDGEIVLWVIRINGETFRVGNDLSQIERSEVIRYQFPQAGWYSLRVTAFDNDGASSTYIPPFDGLWYVGD